MLSSAYHVKPKKIIANCWDFDKTLTKTQVIAWDTGYEPSTQTVLDNLKPEVVNAFRYAWERNGHNAIITNGTKDRVIHYLKEAGFSAEEIAKTPIYAANSKKTLAYGFKKAKMRELAMLWPEVTDFRFYDDRDFFQREVRELIEEFKAVNKSITIVPVKNIPNDYDHLLIAQNKPPLGLSELKAVPVKKIKPQIKPLEIFPKPVKWIVKSKPNLSQRFANFFKCCDTSALVSQDKVNRTMLARTL